MASNGRAGSTPASSTIVKNVGKIRRILPFFVIYGSNDRFSAAFWPAGFGFLKKCTIFVPVIQKNGRPTVVQITFIFNV